MTQAEENMIRVGAIIRRVDTGYLTSSFGVVLRITEGKMRCREFLVDWDSGRVSTLSAHSILWFELVSPDGKTPEEMDLMEWIKWLEK